MLGLSRLTGRETMQLAIKTVPVTTSLFGLVVSGFVVVVAGLYTFISAFTLIEDGKAPWKKAHYEE